MGSGHPTRSRPKMIIRLIVWVYDFYGIKIQYCSLEKIENDRPWPSLLMTVIALGFECSYFKQLDVLGPSMQLGWCNKRS